MCTLSVEAVQVSRELMLVFGTAIGSDCSDIAVTLTLRDASGQEIWQSVQPVDWTEPGRWRASFPLTADRRNTLCRVRIDGDPPRPAWSVAASCPNCGPPDHYTAFLDCCPAIELLGSDVGACEDPTQAGVLLRRVTVRWRVSRRNAGGAIASNARIDVPGNSIIGATFTMEDTATAQDFSDSSFLVPTGVSLSISATLTEGWDCDSTVATLDVDPLPACDCSGQPHSTAAFTIVDGSGTDVSATVLAGRCVAAASVTVTAPTDARSGRFEWVSPATPNAGSPFSTTVALPNTDDGVTVTARIGSAPCIHERSITIRRCQTRPGFCSFLPLSCTSIAVMWTIFFYLATMVGYIGLGLMSAGAITAASDSIMAVVASNLANVAAVLPEPIASKITAAVSAISAAALSVSATAASFATAFGIGFVIACLCGFIIWFMLTLLWLACCAPRTPCLHLRSLSWVLAWIGLTMPVWAVILAVISLVLQLKIMTLAGIGVATVFGFVFTSLLTGLVMLMLLLNRCPIPNPFGFPPFLEESPT